MKPNISLSFNIMINNMKPSPFKADVRPSNDKGQPHGYCILYWYGSNELMSKGYYTNGIETGLWLEYNMKGELIEKIYHII